MRRTGFVNVGVCLALLLALNPARAGAQEEGPARPPASPPPPPRQQIFRMATLAPEGSHWAVAAREAATRIQGETAGRVVLRWFFGAAMGDEATMLARIRQEELDGGVLSMVGLTRAVPSMAVLALPFLFRSAEEARAVSERFSPVFQEKFLEEGLVLLGGFSLGFGRLFTTTRVERLEQLAALRTWVWKGDPLMETVFRTLGFRNLVSLDMTDVLPGLHYGLVDAFSGTCYTISVFQWFPHARYMVPLNWGTAYGGIVVRSAAFQGLSPSDREVFVAVVSDLLALMEAESLRKEEEARRVLVSVEGMEEIRLPAGEVAVLEERAGRAYTTVAERFQAGDLLQSILGSLGSIRGGPR